MNYKPGICNFCGTGCGHLISIEDGKIKGVFASQNHPVSKGRLCVRGWHIHELLRSDDRITQARIKKNGDFAAVDYSEAVAAVIKKLKTIENPSEEIAVLASPRSSNEESYLLAKLSRCVFKTNNISIDSESGHRNSLNVLYAGTGMAGMLGSLTEINQADFIMVVGSDITKQNPIVGSEIHKAAIQGTTLVTICSRNTQIAKLSDYHLQVNPGSKKIILAAMAKALIEENIHDSNYVNEHTEGFEGFANTLGSLNDNDVETLTSINFDDIKQIVRKLASAERAMVFFSSGISGLDEDTISYIYNLFLVAGKVGKPGCGINPISGICNLQGSYDMGAAPDLFTGFQSVKDDKAKMKFAQAWGTDIPASPGKDVYTLLKSGKKIKMLIVIDHDDGIIRYPKEISNCDTVVYITAFKNEFSKYADIILPIATYAETDGTYTNTERRVQLSTKKVEPLNDVLPAWKLYAMIAKEAGVNWNYDSAEAVFKEIASLTPVYAGIDYNKLSDIKGIQWPCNNENPQGTNTYLLGQERVKFVPVSGVFNTTSSKMGYPFNLMTGKANHFWHQNNLMKRTFIPKREYNATLLLYPRGYVEINPEDAKVLQVREKWPVRITSQYGSMEVDVKISNDVKPETAYIPYFIRDMLSGFLMEHKDIFDQGEDAIIPIRIEKV